MERRLEDLRTQARYWRERYGLYHARSYGRRPTSPARLSELKRTAEEAEARLKRAQDAGPASPSGTS